jgi:hypothetical protein
MTKQNQHQNCEQEKFEVVKAYALLYSVRRETTGIGPTDEHSLISSIWRIENGSPERI